MHKMRTASSLPSNSSATSSMTCASLLVRSGVTADDQKCTMTGSGLFSTRSAHSRVSTAGTVPAAAQTQREGTTTDVHAQGVSERPTDRRGRAEALTGSDMIRHGRYDSPPAWTLHGQMVSDARRLRAALQRIAAMTLCSEHGRSPSSMSSEGVDVHTWAM